MKTTFTAGPWHTGGKHKSIVYSDEGFAVASCEHSVLLQSQAAANAALIAAAPDMLSALWEALNTIENMLADLCDEPEEDIEANNTIATIQAAIARATGGN